MRAVRSLILTLVFVAGLAGVASAQYNNMPGTYYNVGVGVVPALTDLPPGSLPSDLPKLGPDLYRGTLTIVRNMDMSYSVSYLGENPEQKLKLNASALFSADWVGIKLGAYTVGMSHETDIITGIDGMHLLSANINGVGHVDGAFKRVIAKFTGDGFTYPPMLTKFIVNPAPGYLR